MSDCNFFSLGRDPKRQRQTLKKGAVEGRRTLKWKIHVQVSCVKISAYKVWLCVDLLEQVLNDKSTGLFFSESRFTGLQMTFFSVENELP